MIELDVRHGSPEWSAVRLAIPTASNFAKLVTPVTRKPSASSRGYMHQLVAEWFLGEPCDPTPESDYVARGSDMEIDAVRQYEFNMNLDTRAVGFVLRDDGSCGCSPDRLVGKDGGLEIKCPGVAAHVANALDMTDAHYAQVQGCMWICDRRWWDFMTFNPVLPTACRRIERDEGFISALAAAVESLHGQMDLAKDRLLRLGWKRLAATEKMEATKRQLVEFAGNGLGGPPSKGIEYGQVG